MHTKQKIGLWQATSLVIGNLIGAGVFLLPAALALYGTLCFVGWAITGLGAIFLAIIFARLSSLIPHTGGPHIYVQAAFGKHWGFYVAWGYWALSWISNAALVVAIAGYTSFIMGGLDNTHIIILEMGLIGAVTIFNLLGVQAVGRIEVLFTILKLIPLLGVPLIGLFYVDFKNFDMVNHSGLSLGDSLNAVAFLTIWSFIGIETGTVPGKAIVDPAKTIPRATIIGVSLVALVYILGTFTIMGVVPSAQLMASKAPYADLASLIFGGNWSIPIAVAAIITCSGSLNGWTLVVSQIALGAGESGFFPPLFKQRLKNGAPKWSIIISSALSLIVVGLTFDGKLMAQFGFIIDVTITLILIIYALCILAYLKLIRSKAKPYKAKIFSHNVIGVFALCFVGWALWATSITMILLSFIIVVAGIPFHRMFLKSVKS